MKDFIEGKISIMHNFSYSGHQVSFEFLTSRLSLELVLWVLHVAPVVYVTEYMFLVARIRLL